MLGFLFELDGRLKGLHFNDTGLAAMLDIYHYQYTTLYPDHPVHQRIAEQEAVGYQICGRKYNDYDVRTMDGQQVRASEYYKDKLTLVICWASWCSPCIRDACALTFAYADATTLRIQGYYVKDADGWMNFLRGTAEPSF